MNVQSVQNIFATRTSTHSHDRNLKVDTIRNKFTLFCSKRAAGEQREIKKVCTDFRMLSHKSLADCLFPNLLRHVFRVTAKKKKNKAGKNMQPNRKPNVAATILGLLLRVGGERALQN